MTVASLIAHMRSREADLASSTVQITADSTSAPTLNTSTGLLTAGSPTLNYDGPALVRPENAAEVDAAERNEHIGRYLVKLPANTTVSIGDQVTVTGSTYDEDLVGKVMTVVDVETDEWQVVRRLYCEEQRG